MIVSSRRERVADLFVQCAQADVGALFRILLRPPTHLCSRRFLFYVILMPVPSWCRFGHTLAGISN